MNSDKQIKPSTPLPERARIAVSNLDSAVTWISVDSNIRNAVAEASNVIELAMKERTELSNAYDTSVAQCGVQMKALSKFVDEREQLIAALRGLLYGAISAEQTMTPAGDKFEAIYESGTLANTRALLAKLGAK